MSHHGFHISHGIFLSSCFIQRNGLLTAFCPNTRRNQDLHMANMVKYLVTVVNTRLPF